MRLSIFIYVLIFCWPMLQVIDQEHVHSLSPSPLQENPMIRIQGGTFKMGDHQGVGGKDERPIHSLTIQDFYVSKYEVSVREFHEFSLDTNYSTDADKLGGSTFWNGEDWIGKEDVNWACDALGEKRSSDTYNHPVVHVSWNDAVAYCNWRSKKEGLAQVYRMEGNSTTTIRKANGYRLPTEAEWEYAARSGGNERMYIWGEEVPMGNVADQDFHSIEEGPYWETYKDGYIYTAPVDAFEQGELGLHQLIGNVWEWCGDWYGADYYAVSANEVSPGGPEVGTFRVIRGGAFSSEPIDCRIAGRTYAYTDSRFNVVGFRLARNGE